MIYIKINMHPFALKHIAKPHRPIIKTNAWQRAFKPFRTGRFPCPDKTKISDKMILKCLIMNNAQHITAGIVHRLRSATGDRNVSRFVIFHGKNSAMQRLRHHTGTTLCVIMNPQSRHNL